MTAWDCAFPLFRSRFLSASLQYNCVDPARAENTLELETGSYCSNHSANSMASNSKTSVRMGKLDLRVLTREDGVPTEVGARRQKMAEFEKKCSQILEGLYMSGEWPAKDLGSIQAHGITHVVNCVGAMCPDYHAERCKYLTFFLQDVPEENILCVLHDALDFIDQARKEGGRVLVHCSQGVSRSATVVIAFCMWKLDKPYDIVFDHVKKIRSVASPNVGFQLDLMQWQKRKMVGIKRCYIQRLAPQGRDAPTYIVPKACSEHSAKALDSRGVFIVHVPGRLYVWVGCMAHQAFIRAADRVAVQTAKYDYKTPVLLTAIDEGLEPEALVAALGEGLQSEGERTNEAYDADFDLVESTSPRTRHAAGGPGEKGKYQGGADAIWGPSRVPSALKRNVGGTSATRAEKGPVPPLRLNAFRATPAA